MLVDEVAGAIVEVLHIRNVGQRAGRMLHAVEPLRIEPLPPLILSICLGEMAIVGTPAFGPDLSAPCEGWNHHQLRA